MKAIGTLRLCGLWLAIWGGGLLSVAGFPGSAYATCGDYLMREHNARASMAEVQRLAAHGETPASFDSLIPVRGENSQPRPCQGFTCESAPVLPVDVPTTNSSSGPEKLGFLALHRPAALNDLFDRLVEGAAAPREGHPLGVERPPATLA